ncbi:hypothetical protein [Variovorax sp.]|uniref:hypothetical protein n=1 Tax=Variovorax sp. TaxID=1871043 RepID=UPI003BADAB80
MAALTADRNTPYRTGDVLNDPVAAGAVIFVGAMFALDAAGNAVAATAGGKRVRAVAQHRADNTGGAAGAQRIEGRRGVWRFGNGTAGAEITRADIGKAAFVVDDQTVGKTGTAVAGEILDVDDGQVWVDIGVVLPAP